jgi:hypothetical protein
LSDLRFPNNHQPIFSPLGGRNHPAEDTPGKRGNILSLEVVGKPSEAGILGRFMVAVASVVVVGVLWRLNRLNCRRDGNSTSTHGWRGKFFDVHALSFDSVVPGAGGLTHPGRIPFG